MNPERRYERGLTRSGRQLPPPPTRSFALSTLRARPVRLGRTLLSYGPAVASCAVGAAAVRGPAWSSRTELPTEAPGASAWNLTPAQHSHAGVTHPCYKAARRLSTARPRHSRPDLWVMYRPRSRAAADEAVAGRRGLAPRSGRRRPGEGRSGNAAPLSRPSARRAVQGEGEEPAKRAEGVRRSFAGAGYPSSISWMLARRRAMACVWIWHTRDSVTSSTSPISRRVSSSW